MENELKLNKFNLIVLWLFLFCSDSHIYAKTSMEDEFSKFKFLPKRVRRNPVLLATLPLVRPGARGINRRKKRKLIRALMPLMHAYPRGEQRALFWERLPADRNSRDLQQDNDSDREPGVPWGSFFQCCICFQLFICLFVLLWTLISLSTNCFGMV